MILLIVTNKILVLAGIRLKTVQEAINKVSNLAGSENSIDEFHADGVVKNINGELGFDVSVNPENPLEVIYTGGIAYVGGYRYVIAPGVILVNASTTHQTLVVNDKGQMEIFISKTDSKKFASIAVISTYQGEITRIVDTRFDLTHVDNKVEQNFQRTAEARTDRRQFVPLLAYSIKGLKYVDGRDKNFELGTTKTFITLIRIIFFLMEIIYGCAIYRVRHFEFRVLCRIKMILNTFH